MTTAIAKVEPTVIVSLGDLATRINGAHRRCEDAARSAVQYAVEAGGLLIEAKSLHEHGSWTKWIEENCEFSLRTAQVYMFIAREFPKLPEEKAQRAASLSIRAAHRLIKAEVGQQHKLKLVEQTELPPPMLKPPPTGGRKMLVLQNRKGHKFLVGIGPNDAGIKLAGRVEQLKQMPRYEEWKADIEGMRAEAKRLREEADNLEKQARDDAGCMHAQAIDNVEEEHGEALAYTETREYVITDAAVEKQILSLGEEAAADYLLNNEDGDTVKEVERGYWGNIVFVPLSALPPCPNGWTKTGIEGPFTYLEMTVA